MKKLIIVAVFVAVFLIVTLTAILTRREETDRLQLKFGGILVSDHPAARAYEYFARRVGEITEGRVTVKVYHSGGLGDAVELVDYLIQGTVDFAQISSSNLNQIEPRMDVFSLPYLFKDQQHYRKALKSRIGQETLSWLKPYGIIGLYFADAGARSIYNNVRPIEKPEDLKGLKIRIMESPVVLKSLKAMGADPAPMSWGELYTALQTGVLDGAENNPPSILTGKHYEVVKYYSLTEHMRIPDIVVMSRKTWDRLPTYAQEALVQAASEAQEWEWREWEKFNTEALDKLKELMKVNAPDPTPFAEITRPALQQCAADLGVTEMVNEIERLK